MTDLFHKVAAPFARHLDRTGMYRVVTQSLIALTLISLIAGAFGRIPYTVPEQLISLALALGTAFLFNALGARLWRIHVNYESAIITALIVHFLVVPPTLSSVVDNWQVMAVTAIAITSKFVLAWRGQHLMNPAATGAVVLALGLGFFSTTGFYSGWWIGSPTLFIPLLICGALVVSKVRAWPPVLAFLGVGFLVFLFEEWRFSGDVITGAQYFWLSGPSIFLAAFMLTEPFTMPPTRNLRLAYGALVGAIAQTSLFMPFVTITPELALVAGNLAFFSFTVRQKLRLPLLQARTIADRTYELIFKKPASFTFKAGQYLEWMLPHQGADSRGIRRYFTIASSPTEPDIRLALRVPPEAGSTYKQSLVSLAPGQVVTASQLAGDFVLPSDHTLKIAMVAGGIGVTPFRSHLAFLTDAGTKQDIVLFYCNNTAAEIAYKDEFAHFAKALPLRIVHVLAKETVRGAEYEQGFLSGEIIVRRSPDYRERLWYVSGPPPMVNAITSQLRTLGVPRGQIVKDFFPGLA